ncbi:hypothetical protein KIH87_16075 [Paraneptunicella aestuarii]|uniref:hypothetical protein n=1 Tax=Paraneptunicella aestuarii TaxID=2831148 RepID=UPI001E64DE94|nr:hypothetical protein [Paraneptunicella aestuarii]UAA38190.1 hypothetical protein KIH87_16075 [Paraneptunicella aestuarii]
MKIYFKTKHYLKSYIGGSGQIAKQRMMISLRRHLLVIKKGLAQETIETKEMLGIYHRYTMGKASKEEMRFANQQFVDVVRSVGLGIMVVLPFSPITLPAIVKLGDKLGVSVLPSSFEHMRNEFSEADTSEILIDDDENQPQIEQA